MTPAAFSVAFPEFGNTSAVLVQSRLQFAAARLGGPDFSIWPPFGLPGQLPSLTDLAQGHLAAHYLQSSAFGTETRLKPSESKTSYWEVFEDCCLCVAGGFIVAGEMPVLPVFAVPGNLVLTPGNGTVAVTNGQTAITFANLQTLAAGTLVVFYAQPGVYYSLALNVNNSLNGVITAPYEGTTSPNSSWAF